MEGFSALTEVSDHMASSGGGGFPALQVPWSCMSTFHCGEEARLGCNELIRCSLEGLKSPQRLAAAFLLVYWTVAAARL
jgi:hypothetical protein